MGFSHVDPQRLPADLGAKAKGFPKGPQFPGTSERKTGWCKAKTPGSGLGQTWVEIQSLCQASPRGSWRGSHFLASLGAAWLLGCRAVKTTDG